MVVLHEMAMCCRHNGHCILWTGSMGAGGSPTVPGWVGPPKRQPAVENAAVQIRENASLGSHALADSAVAAEGDAREPWDSVQPADSGPRPMHAWKSFGNKSYRVNDSLTSSSSSSLQVCGDSDACLEASVSECACLGELTHNYTTTFNPYAGSEL